MQISVLIPTYNRGYKIINTFEALRTQTIPVTDFEVIIIDDASTDNTGIIVQDYLTQYHLTGWQYLRQTENTGRAGALNTGILVATSALVAFTDDDIMPTPGWIAAHITRHQREMRPVVVVGKVSYPPDWVAKSNLVRYHNSTYMGHNRFTASAIAGDPLPPTYLSGGNSSLPKKTLTEIGMFNSVMRRGQDGELGVRLWQRGISIVYEPGAEVIHYAEAAESYRQWIWVSQRYYHECAQEMLKLYPEVYHRYFHWFVEPPVFGQEPVKRTIKKLILRLLARPWIGKMVTQFMERHDADSKFYYPILYKYILTCAAIEAVDMRLRITR